MPANGKAAQMRKVGSGSDRNGLSSASRTTSAKRPSTTRKARQSNRSTRSGSDRRSNIISGSVSDSNDNASQSSASQEPSSDFEEPEFILAEIEHEDARDGDATSSDEVKIPKDLIHRLLHHHFQEKDKTNINPDAKEAVCKYVEVFVREALARSAFMRQEADNGDGDVGDGFLEVEDLEKCAPLLVLDF